MFTNRDKDKANDKIKGGASQLPALDMISKGTVVKGTLDSQNDVRVEGRIEGGVLSKGKLVVISSAMIAGDVHVAEADISGRIEGTLKITNKLIVRQSAIIDGEIHAKTLMIEEGAQVNGACHMGQELEKTFHGEERSDMDVQVANKNEVQQQTSNQQKQKQK